MLLAWSVEWLAVSAVLHNLLVLQFMLVLHSLAHASDLVLHSLLLVHGCGIDAIRASVVEW